MYEDDFVMRQIRQLSQALARVLQGDRVEREELDAAVRAATGLDLATIDALPAEALLQLLIPTDDRSAERLAVMAELLEATAAPGPAGDARRAKAAALRAP